MIRKQSQKIIVVVGPTASGKSDLALRLAKLAQGLRPASYESKGTELAEVLNL